jgi:hypothetical protein
MACGEQTRPEFLRKSSSFSGSRLDASEGESRDSEADRATDQPFLIFFGLKSAWLFLRLTRPEPASRLLAASARAL